MFELWTPGLLLAALAVVVLVWSFEPWREV
jgi:hypothetical protein